MHIAWRRILPYCKVARSFGLLPFTKYDDEERKLKTSKIVEAVSLCVLLTAYTIYLLHICRSMKKFMKSFEENAAATMVVTFATFCVMQTSDVLNVLAIIRLSRGSLKLVNQLLKKIERVDHLLHFEDASPILFRAIGSFCYTWTKIATLMYVFDYNDLVYHAGIRFISAITINTENFYCLLCHEIATRFRLINAELCMVKRKERVLDERCLQRLSECFEIMLKATHLLKKRLKRFLLFNCSTQLMSVQLHLLGLYMMIFNGKSSIIMNNERAFLLKGLGYCFLGFEAATRFIFLNLACHAVEAESNKTEELLSRVMSSHLDEATLTELQLFAQILQARQTSFSACGLFHLNAPLIFAAAGTICSYFLVITQLK